jgi:prepilin-type N-terminal cleavage/methylation domain-containing protein
LKQNSKNMNRWANRPIKNRDSGVTLVEILVVIILIGIVAAIAIPTFISIMNKFLPSCNKDTCINLDPVVKRCHKNVTTVKRNRELGVLIELRYSPTCNASWARVTFAPVNSAAYVIDSSGKQYGYWQNTDRRWNQFYGDMGPGVELNACVKLPNGQAICTFND